MSLKRHATEIHIRLTGNQITHLRRKRESLYIDHKQSYLDIKVLLRPEFTAKTTRYLKGHVSQIEI